MFVCTKFDKWIENLIGSQLLVLCKFSWSQEPTEDLTQVIGFYTDSYLSNNELSKLNIIIINKHVFLWILIVHLLFIEAYSLLHKVWWNLLKLKLINSNLFKV